MRYLITTSLSRVSMWMSEARRLSASNTVESTSRMIGDWSAWILSIDSTSSPLSSSRTSWILKDSEACSSTRCVPWLRLSASWIAEGVPTAGCTCVCSTRLSSSTTGSAVGSAITSTSRSPSRRYGRNA